MRRLDYQFPLFFLPRAQAVAEYFPFHIQRPFGQAFTQLYPAVVQLAVLDEGKLHGYSVAVFFPVWVFHTENRIVQRQGAAFQPSFLPEDIYQDVCVLMGSPEVEYCRMSGVELRVFFIEEGIHKYSRMRVGR